jgi:nitrate reductase gamma subunit
LILAYLSIFSFLLFNILRVRRYLRMPIHLRWELYPVAHETERTYGGSNLEDLDAWKKPRHKSIWGELRFMGAEIFAFKAYYRHSRSYWYLVYPFHIGIFLLVSWVILLLAGAITSLTGILITMPAQSTWVNLVYFLILITGIGGLVLTLIGSLGLFVNRLTNTIFRFYTTPIDILNLIFIILITVSGLFSWAVFDSDFNISRDFIKSLITFSRTVNLNVWIYIQILLICLFLLYAPFTRVTHYIAKFFAFHRVQWDDTTNKENPDIAVKVNNLLNQTPSWSASHIQSGLNWKQITKEAPDKKTCGN